MRFQLTESQRALREEVRDVVATETEPSTADLDRLATYPEEPLAELGDRGITGLTIPEDRSGRGVGPLELAIVIEELPAAQMALASTVALNLGVATAVERFGSDRRARG
jgi:alkylation response protein AidB-like acyl-CoA dehydrogenase